MTSQPNTVKFVKYCIDYLHHLRYLSLRAFGAGVEHDQVTGTALTMHAVALQAHLRSAGVMTNDYDSSLPWMSGEDQEKSY
jgi:hypothetical protein